MLLKIFLRFVRSFLSVVRTELFSLPNGEDPNGLILVVGVGVLIFLTKTDDSLLLCQQLLHF